MLACLLDTVTQFDSKGLVFQKQGHKMTDEEKAAKEKADKEAAELKAKAADKEAEKAKAASSESKPDSASKAFLDEFSELKAFVGFKPKSDAPPASTSPATKHDASDCFFGEYCPYPTEHA